MLGAVIPWAALSLERTCCFAATQAHKPRLGFAVGLLLYALTAITHASAFLAAFAAGITVATVAPSVRDAFHEFGELLAALFELAALLALALTSPQVLKNVPWTLAGALAYTALIVLLRASGKRTLSKMNAFDLMVSVALGSTLATIVLSKDVALAEGLAAFGTLIGLQFVVAWLCVRVKWVSRLVKAEPSLLLHRGEFLHAALKRERVVEDEVRCAVRSRGTLRSRKWKPSSRNRRLLQRGAPHRRLDFRPGRSRGP